MDEAKNFVYSFFVDNYLFLIEKLLSIEIVNRFCLSIKFWVSCVFLLIVEVGTAAQVENRVLIQSVAMVGQQILTSREVRAMILLDAALNDRTLNKRTGSPGFETLLGRVSAEDVNGEIIELILSQEAEVFAFNQLAPGELALKLEKIKKIIKVQEDWQRLELSENEISRLLRRKLLAKGYLNFKTTTMTSQVSDSEALAYFEKNKVKFVGLPFDQMKSNIKNFLTQQQLQERLNSYFEAMKRKYKVRNILSEQVME